MQCYFFGYLLGILYNLAGFQSNIKKVQEKYPSKIFHVFAGKTSNFMSTDGNISCKQFFMCARVAKEFVLLEFFFGGNLFCMQTVEIRNIYHFLDWKNKNRIFHAAV